MAPTPNMDSWERPFAEFFRLMSNRMRTSEYKYGDVYDNYPKKVDALRSMESAVERYHVTHNTEYLLDAANFLLIEATCPRYRDASFVATDSDKSAGLSKKGRS